MKIKKVISEVQSLLTQLGIEDASEQDVLKVIYRVFDDYDLNQIRYWGVLGDTAVRDTLANQITQFVNGKEVPTYGDGFEDPVAVDNFWKEFKNAFKQKLSTLPDVETRFKAFISHPLRGNIEENVQKTKIFVKKAFDEGYLPIAPNLYTDCLDMNDPKSVAAGLDYALYMLLDADELWICGELTEGVLREIEVATKSDIEIKYLNNQQ